MSISFLFLNQAQLVENRAFFLKLFFLEYNILLPTSFSKVIKHNTLWSDIYGRNQIRNGQDTKKQIIQYFIPFATISRTNILARFINEETLDPILKLKSIKTRNFRNVMPNTVTVTFACCKPHCFKYFNNL